MSLPLSRPLCGDGGLAEGVGSFGGPGELVFGPLDPALMVGVGGGVGGKRNRVQEAPHLRKMAAGHPPPLCTVTKHSKTNDLYKLLFVEASLCSKHFHASATFSHPDPTEEGLFSQPHTQQNRGSGKGGLTRPPPPWDFRAHGQLIKAAAGCSVAPLNPPDSPAGRGPAQGGRQPRLGTWSGQDMAVGAE